MKPTSKKMRALVASAAVVAGVAGAFSTQASAIITGGDDVLLQTVGFDFGAIGFANGNPTANGSFAWSQGPTGPTGYATGYLHFDGVANNCARIRTISYDSAGVEIGNRNYSPDECVHVNGHVARYVAPVDGELGAASVEVALQSRIDVAGSNWSTIRRQTFNLPTLIDTDTFRIIAPGRIKVDYISQLGTVTTRYTPGTNACVHDDQLHTFPIHLDGFHSPDVYEVTYTLQKSPEGANNWTDVATSTPIIL